MLDEKDLNYIIEAHRKSKPNKSTRLWDKKTPYSIHPIWCAMTLLHETSLPEDLRRDGSQALLYHDILEDTEYPLPSWLSTIVQELVIEMTFESSRRERKDIWTKFPEVRLLKLYDKVSNLMDGIWMLPERRKEYEGFISRLCDDVEENYDKLNITRIARTII